MYLLMSSLRLLLLLRLPETLETETVSNADDNNLVVSVCEKYTDYKEHWYLYKDMLQ